MDRSQHFDVFGSGDALDQQSEYPDFLTTNLYGPDAALMAGGNDFEQQLQHFSDETQNHAAGFDIHHESFNGSVIGGYGYLEDARNDSDSDPVLGNGNFDDWWSHNHRGAEAYTGVGQAPSAGNETAAFNFADLDFAEQPQPVGHGFVPPEHTMMQPATPSQYACFPANPYTVDSIQPGASVGQSIDLDPFDFGALPKDPAAYAQQSSAADLFDFGSHTTDPAAYAQKSIEPTPLQLPRDPASFRGVGDVRYAKDLNVGSDGEVEQGAGKAPAPEEESDNERQCEHSTACKRPARYVMGKYDGQKLCTRHAKQWEINHSPHPEWQPFVCTLQEAVQLIRPWCVPPSFYRSPEYSDPTLAQHRGHGFAWTQRFHAAAMTPYAGDKAGLRGHQSQFDRRAKSRKAGEYSEQMICARISLLFPIALAYHQGGPSAYGMGGDNSGYRANVKLNFVQRLAQIEDMMKLNKRVVMDVIEGRGVEAFVRGPAEFEKRKQTNKEGNEDRQKKLDAAASRNTEPSRESSAESEGLDAEEPVHRNMSGRSAATVAWPSRKRKQSAGADDGDLEKQPLSTSAAVKRRKRAIKKPGIPLSPYKSAAPSPHLGSPSSIPFGPAVQRTPMFMSAPVPSSEVKSQMLGAEQAHAYMAPPQLPSYFSGRQGTQTPVVVSETSRGQLNQASPISWAPSTGATPQPSPYPRPSSVQSGQPERGSTHASQRQRRPDGRVYYGTSPWPATASVSPHAGIQSRQRPMFPRQAVGQRQTAAQSAPVVVDPALQRQSDWQAQSQHVHLRPLAPAPTATAAQSVAQPSPRGSGHQSWQYQQERQHGHSDGQWQ